MATALGFDMPSGLSNRTSKTVKNMHIDTGATMPVTSCPRSSRILVDIWPIGSNNLQRAHLPGPYAHEGFTSLVHLLMKTSEHACTGSLNPNFTLFFYKGKTRGHFLWQKSSHQSLFSIQKSIQQHVANTAATTHQIMQSLKAPSSQGSQVSLSRSHAHSEKHSKLGSTSLPHTETSQFSNQLQHWSTRI